MDDLIRDMAQAIVVRWDETRKVFKESGKEPPHIMGLMFHGREVAVLREALDAPVVTAVPAPPQQEVETRIVMQEVYEGYLAYIVACLNDVFDGGLQRVNPVLEFREWKVQQATGEMVQ